MDFFHDDFDNCFVKTIDSIKLLLYNRHKDIFERLDFYDNGIYQEPLLYVYMAQPDNKWLDSIIYGYEKKANNKIQIFTNKKGVAYIPNLGYFKTEKADATLVLDKKNSEYQIKDQNNKIVHFYFEPIYYLDEGIELVKAQHPLFECLFVNPDEINISFENEKTYIDHTAHFNNALFIIKTHYSDYFDLLKKNVKKVMYFEGNNNSFATVQAHNMLFLNISSENDEVFFVDHILHEGSHVIFNTLTFNTKNNLFTVSFRSPFSDFTKNPKDLGDIYGRFHGLFTQSNINTCLEICINKNVFTKRQHHELLGRFSSNMKRFNTAVEIFNSPELYKNEGLKWYDFFKSKCSELTKRNRELIYSFDVSNQPYIFSYEIFKATNS